MKLLLNMIIKFICGVLLVGVLLFVPAGTLFFYNAWLLMGLLFIPILIFGIVLYIKNPKLLKRRLDMKEKEFTQKIVILLSMFVFICGFIICGLDYKYSWSDIPNYIVIIGSIVLLISYLLYVFVIRENEFLLRTIKVEKEQKLIDTGLYGIVRHPMYFSSLLLFLSMPLILDSLYGFYIFFVIYTYFSC